MTIILFIYAVITFFSSFAIFRKGRVFDFISLGFLSLQIYFMPILFQLFGQCTPYGCLKEEIVYISIFLMICMVFFSFLKLNDKRIEIKPVVDIKFFSIAALLLASLSFLYIIYSSSGKIFLDSKSEMSGYLGYGFIIWSFSSILAFLGFYSIKNKFFTLLSFSFICITIYIGFRSTAAIAIISIFLLMSKEYKLSINKIKLQHVFLFLFVVFFFFIYKGIYTAIKFDNYELVFTRLSDYQYYIDSFLDAEPSIISYIMSEVLSEELQAPKEQIYNIFLSFGLFGSLFPDLDTFNDIIQPRYFPGVHWGAGSSVWANVFALTGWIGLFTFCFIYCFTLYAFSSLYKKLDGTYLIILTVIATYWGFYIHRNDLSYQINLEKRVIITAILIIIMAYIIKAFYKFFKK